MIVIPLNVILLLTTLGLIGSPPEPTEVLTLKSGQRLEADVLRVSGESARLRIHIGGGTAEVDRRLDEFEAHSAYRILAAVTAPDSAQAHLELARFAGRNGLIAVAQRELAQSRSLGLDPAIGKPAGDEIANKAATLLEALFRQSLDARDATKARRYLSELLVQYAETEPAKRGERLLQELKVGEEAIESYVAQQAAAREAARANAERERLLKPLRKHLDDAAESNKKGLLSSRKIGEALSNFDAARGHYNSILDGAEKLLKDRKSDPELANVVSVLYQNAKTRLVDTLLNSGSLATVQSDFRGAIGYVNEAIALDPLNRDARDLRARIEIAASRGRWHY